MSPSVARVRRLARSRGFLIAAGMVAGILVLQMVTTVVGVIAATRLSQAAALDTYSYVGDLTAERVERYAESARDAATGTADQLERDPDISDEDLVESMYLRLEREPTVRAVYVGRADGSFVVVRRDGSGFDVQVGDPEAGDPGTTTDYDATFTPLGSRPIDAGYDPRTRPWYQAGLSGTGIQWTDPYAQFDGASTLVSATRAARSGQGLIGVAGADLETDSLGLLLADLPIGEGAVAYLLSPEGLVIATPAGGTTDAVTEAREAGEVPTATELGITMPEPPPAYGVDEFEVEGSTIILNRALDPEEHLDWILHFEAEESQLSPGLDRLTGVVVAITVFSLVIALGALVVALRVWRPLRAMRDRAATDQLTGLANRHELLRRGSALVDHAAKRGDTVVAVVLDLDNFKRLNDRYGHNAGDYALETVALALRENIRAGDLAARTGGDEFVVIQVQRPQDDTREIVGRMRDQVERALHTRVLGGEGVGVTAGFATAERGEPLDALMQRADVALVEGKARAKGEVYGG
ncbi:sensor domain-containing diguanylate cyclase [uncultured Demequina sp.]|uniref:sensor domain-containing diguanylate cyclase n=1 Tax=uncultured Demequina sp. TaxID=693499 RepID=UPI0025D7B799|nr:sensor domain-containing diguanylate cyclase [uncultured Demequina sp.]